MPVVDLCHLLCVQVSLSVRAAETQRQADMTMQVGDIMILRDGGTITFTIVGGDLSGKYRLQTPLAGEPRLLFRDVIRCLEART